MPAHERAPVAGCRSCIDFAHWASVGHDRWTCMGGEKTCDPQSCSATPAYRRWHLSEAFANSVAKLATGWRTLSSGAYGFNYLHRASTNYVGLGATVREESGAYTTSRPTATGSHCRVRPDNGLAIEPPPVDAFWSLSAYDVDTRELVPNPIARYVINGQMPGLRWQPDGIVGCCLGRTVSPPRAFTIGYRYQLAVSTWCCVAYPAAQ